MNKYLGDYIPVKTEIPNKFEDHNDFNHIGVELFKEINEQIFSYTFNLSVAYNEFRF